MDLVALQTVASKFATKAGELAKQMRIEAIQNLASKSSATDMVTTADKAAEILITEGISQARPNDSIYGEEGAHIEGSSDVTWHIDPIDGTVNYIYGLPYAVSIGMAYKGKLVVGAVYAPESDELFVAADGLGATCNEKPLHCSRLTSLQSALVATGFSYLPENRIEQSKILTANISKVRDIRRIGSASLDLCAVAAGRIDAYYEQHVNIWDVAAGVVIAKEAGAIATDMHGAELYSDSILAAGPDVHEQLLELFRT